jgi:hypothetical protein
VCHCEFHSSGSEFTPVNEREYIKFTPVNEREYITFRPVNDREYIKFTPVNEREYIKFTSVNEREYIQFTPVNDREYIKFTPVIGCCENIKNICRFYKCEICSVAKQKLQSYMFLLNSGNNLC